MTPMPPATIAADSLLSYARLEGDAVRVVLALEPDSAVSGDRFFVRFGNGDTQLRFPAELEQAGGRRRVVVSVPREELADGVWRLRLREGGGALHDLRARVLLHGDQPIALLFGKTANI